MAKRLNARALKKNRSYSIQEAADALGVHEQTIREWGRKGLRLLKSRKPNLVLGCDLHAFLDDYRQARKRPLGRNQVYCLKCRAAVKPLGNMADYVAQTDDRGRLSALCPTCETLCHRFIAKTEISLIAPDLEVAFPTARKSLNEE